MGQYATAIEGEPRKPPSVQQADTNNSDIGKLSITFAKPEEAEAAVSVWTSLGVQHVFEVKRRANKVASCWTLP